MGTVTTLGRFQIIEGAATIAPGKCTICGTTQGPFVDFGFELDFYGVVYFCLNSCVVELCNLLAFVPPAKWAAIDELNEHLRDENARLFNENERLRDVIATLQHISSARTIDPVNNIPNTAVEESATDTDVSDNNTDKPNSRSKRAKQRLNEQDNESGPTDIQHNDSSIENLLDGI